MDNVEIRAVRAHERDATLKLWVDVFSHGAGDDGYFMRYFRDDPWYRDEDCRVAVVEGRVVSCVHVCRRPLQWHGQEILCGGIANVATHPEFQRRGLSGRLLLDAVEQMQRSGLAFSMLFTGKHGHYARAGWSTVQVPYRSVSLPAETPAPEGLVRHLSGWPVPDEVRGIYECLERPLMLVRPASYWHGWVGWNWRGAQDRGALMVAGPPDAPEGYLAASLDDRQPDRANVAELMAAGGRAEVELLRGLAHWMREHGRTAAQLPAGLSPEAEQLVATWGADKPATHGGMMLRAITLDELEMGEIESAYRTGAARWWPSDGF